MDLYLEYFKNEHTKIYCVNYQPNMSAFLSGEYEIFEEETRRLLEVSNSIVIKPMLELGLIPSREEKIRAIKILDNAGAELAGSSQGIEIVLKTDNMDSDY